MKKISIIVSMLLICMGLGAQLKNLLENEK